MRDDKDSRMVIDNLGGQPGEILTPERVEAIQTAMHQNLGRFINTTSYLVLGSYGEDERPRLEAVRNRLSSEAVISETDDEVSAFLMDEMLDFTEFYTTKFKVLVSYADHIVGVYEHSQGGHAWESGYIDQPAYRDRTTAFYRVHDTDEAQYSAYDGMFAHYLLSMHRMNSAQTWRTPDELFEAIQMEFVES